MSWPPADGTAYMPIPSNGTEFEIFYGEMCAHCVHDDPDNEKYCEIIMKSMCGDQPDNWTWSGGLPSCSAFSTEVHEPRCPFTLEMFDDE